MIPKLYLEFLSVHSVHHTEDPSHPPNTPKLNLEVLRLNFHIMDMKRVESSNTKGFSKIDASILPA